MKAGRAHQHISRIMDFWRIALGDIRGDISRLNRADRCKAAPMLDLIGAAIATTYRIPQTGAEGRTYFRDRCLQPLGHPSKCCWTKNLRAFNSITQVGFLGT